MRSVWQITKDKSADSAFEGEGGRRAGGRFSNPGRPVVYTSESLALAELEILVNLPMDRLLGGYVAFSARIPESQILTLNRKELPAGWGDNPAPEATKEIGTRWLEEGTSLALQVPSAVVPTESNILLNPRHPSFKEVQIESTDRLTQRLMGT